MGLHIAQMVEHWSANAEAMGSNPVEGPKKEVYLQLLKLQLLLRRQHQQQQQQFNQKQWNA